MNDHGSSQRPLDRSPASLGGDESTARAEPGQIVPPTLTEDRTVISNKPPLALPSLRSGMHPSEMGEKLEGERLGHFELREFIGGGGMGAVFRAIDTMLNRTVAVKVLATEQSSDEETIRRFKNEAQSAARLDHENIARVYYVGEDRGVHYIVFEHIEGINIRDLVAQQGPLPFADAISFTLQVAAALDHASQRDVVHRDIKPSNILTTHRGRAKLVDMGLARLHQVEHTDNDLTASGVTLGTFDYISPEQARDPRTADVRSDLYSLGCTLYFMLTGRPPFPEGTVLQKLLQHQADAAPDPRQIRPDVPEELAVVVAKLLSKRPLDRHQTPAELIAELKLLSPQVGLYEGGPAAAPEATRRGPSALVRAVPWLVPAALLLAGVALLETLWSQSEETLKLPEIRRTETATGSETTPPTTPEATAVASIVPTPPQEAAPSEPAPAPDPAEAEASPSEAGNPPAVPATASTTEPAAAQPEPQLASLAPQHALRTRLGKALATDGLRPEGATGELGATESGMGLVMAHPIDGMRGELTPTEFTSSTNAAATTSEESTKRSGILVVTPGADAPAFNTLRAACRAAQTGDIIELRYNGILVEKPLLLVNKRLTIRAGDGFLPHIVFQPGADAVDPVEYPRSMLTLAGGELTLINVSLQLNVPRNVASDHWALFETRGSQSVSLRRCLLTIRNAAEGQAAYHPNVSFFELAASPGSDGMMGDNSPADELPVTLRIKDSIARGEAHFTRSDEMQSLDLTWENGLLAISGRLGTFESAPTFSRNRVSVQFNLQHLTSVTRPGLLAMSNSDDAPHPIDMKVKSSDSIFLADESAVLVEQEGVDRVDSFQNQLTWNGDRNFYEGFEIFWRIGGDVDPNDAQQLQLDTWQQFWQMRTDAHENRPLQRAVVWAELPAPQRPFHTHLPSDYALNSRGVENPAHGAASDGRDVGLRADLLPVDLMQLP